MGSFLPKAFVWHPNVAFFSCARALGDRPHHFEPARVRTHDLTTDPPSFRIIPTGGRLSPDRFNVHCSSTRRLFSGSDSNS
ncbi:hypothetical protein TNCV_831041 [Trichonephila clavipes]|nr:hypothetical protein TNCV_831041 [Trichonephila clavipes]